MWYVRRRWAPYLSMIALKQSPIGVVLGSVVPGKRLSLLIHHRLHKRAPVQSDKDNHLLTVAIAVSEKVPVIVTNAHFSPGMKATDRRFNACLAQLGS